MDIGAPHSQFGQHRQLIFGRLDWSNHSGANMPASNDTIETNAPTTLLAEDDPFLRELISVRLRATGFPVIEAATGEDALPHMEGGGIDVLVTDISMPGAVDGWSLAERARLAHPRIAVVYASGTPADIARQVSHSLYLRKPFHPDAIISAIRQLTSWRDVGGRRGED